MMIRFGGPNWGGASRTWFYDLSKPLGNAPGEYSQTFVTAGESFPADRIQDWQSYVDRGIAEVVADDIEPANSEALNEAHGMGDAGGE